MHRARLPGGQQVVVKVQRPDAERQINADIQLLYQVARVARERVRRLQFIDLVGPMGDSAVRRARSGETPSHAEQDAVALEVVALAARLAAESDGVLQLHLGARRDLSSRILEEVGRDAGADAVDDRRQAPGLTRFLAGLERDGTLPRTVLYNANPADDTVFATVAGAFSRVGVAPLVQWGPPWWFNDHEDGMRRQLDVLSRTGRLAGFVGMVTDSRSLVSMTRHELFRRILCDTLGRDTDNGLIPADPELLSGVVRSVCVENAVAWHGL